MIPITPQNVSDTKITVTGTATSLYDLINTASSTNNAQKYYDDRFASAVFIQAEDGDIRYLINGAPTATEGILVKSGNKEYLPGIELFGMQIIRTGGSDVAVTVVPYRSEPRESPALVQADAGSGSSSVVVTDIEDGAGDTIMDTVNDAMRVNIVAGSSSGTEYTEDDVAPANPVAGALSLVRQDTPAGLTTTDGDIVTQRATNFGAAFTQILDSSGNFIDTFGGSGGTSSIDDSAFTAGSGSGTPAMGFFSADTVDSGDVGVLAMDASRRLFTSIEVDNVGLATSANQLPDGHNVTVDNASGASAVNIQDGGNSITVDGTVTAAPSVTGGGTEATAQRVTIANDSTGLLSVDDNGSSLTVDTTGTSGLEVVQVTAGDLNMTEASGATIATNTGNTDTNTTDIPNVIGTDGSTGPTSVLSIGGTQSTGEIEELRVDSDGHLQVDVLSGGGGGTLVQDGDAVNAADTGGLILGTDGSNYQILATDSSGNLQTDVLSSALPTGAATSANQLPDGHNVTVDNASIAVTQSGVWDITDITGTVSLPTGAATAANQTSVIGTDGATGPASVLSIGGTESGGNIQEILVDSTGALQVDVLSGGGGSEQTLGTSTYLEGTSTGIYAAVVRNDTLATLVDTDNEAAPMQVNAIGALYVEVDSSALPSGAATSANQLADGHNVTVDNASGASAVNIQDGGNSITVDNAALSVTGGGVEASALRVTIANDSTGLLTVDQPTAANLNMTEASGASIATNTSNSATSLAIMDDWDNAASDGASVSGDTAHDAADAGEPVKVGGKAIDMGTDPTEVASNDRTDNYSTRAGIPFVQMGHPNILSKSWNITDADGAQTDLNLLAAVVGANDVCIVTGLSVNTDEATTAGTQCRIGFGATNTPGLDGAAVLISAAGIPPGGGQVLGFNGGMVGRGASGEELRMTSADPSGGSIDIVVSYYIIDNS